MAIKYVCDWHCECSACGWGTSGGFRESKPQPPGSGGSFTFFSAPEGSPPPVGMDDTYCPRCGAWFSDEERLYTS